MPLLDVPVIDLAPARSGDPALRLKVAREIDRACEDIGFLVISGHGVPANLIDQTDAVSRAFFDLPMAEKRKVAQPAPDVTRGYIALEAESVARSRGDKNAPGDLNESFMIGPVDSTSAPYFHAPEAGKHFHPNLWPDLPPNLRPLYEETYRAMADLAAELMRLFALALELPEDFFDDKIDRHISRLRVRNYPALESAPVPGQLRVGAHSDYGSLTILKTEKRGLEVRNKAGEWVEVPILPGCFVVNLGELMARWTNDRWVSTLHRVVNPPVGAGDLSRRQSIVFFHNPNYDAEIRCIPSCADREGGPKYPVTTSGEHLRSQFLRTNAQNAY